MAGLHAVTSFSDSLAQFLGNTYPVELRDVYPCDFRVVSSNELDTEDDFGTAVTVYLYRIIVNEHLRNKRKVDLNSRVPPLSLDLHFLISIWADSAAAEHSIAAWVMRQMYLHPVMDASSLSQEGQWDASDVVHIIPAELSNEDLMRIWDAITPGYRLSMSYIARPVRMDPPEIGSELPVVGKRLRYEQKVT